MSSYYVYSLTDPRDDAVFYIGKGKDNRIDAHEKEALKGVHSRKCERIREILSNGLQVKKQKIKFFLQEQDAYDFEKELIDQIGLHRLTNVVAGGGGVLPERKPAQPVFTSKDWLKVLLLRPSLTAQWLIHGMKKATVTFEGNEHTKIYSYVIASLFNAALPKALQSIKDDSVAQKKFAEAMKNYGITIAYA